MNRLPLSKRVQLVAALTEGMSLRAATRMVDCSINTVTKLLVELGAACAEYHDRTVRNIPAKRLQCDEIWQYVYAKKKNVTEEIKKKVDGAGDVWTWTVLDSDTKLMVSYLIGPRTLTLAFDIIEDLHGRVQGHPNIPQISTDGLPWYAHAIDRYFGIDVHYGVISKTYANIETGG